MASHKDSRAMIVAVVTECRVIPVVQGMGSMEVIEVTQVRPVTVFVILPPMRDLSIVMTVCV